MKKALNFDNTKTSFSLKSDFELKQARFLFSAIGISWLTAMAKPVTNFLFKVRFPIGPILKKTVFKHFCGGETIAECKTLINELYDQKGVCLLYTSDAADELTRVERGGGHAIYKKKRGHSNDVHTDKL